MKTMKRILLCLLLVLGLTGCMKMNMTVEVKDDLSMVVGMEMLVEEELITADGTTTTDEYLQQMKQQILDEDGYENAQVDTVKKTIDGASWVGVTVSGIANGDDGVTVKKDTVDGKECIVLTFPMDDLEDEMDMDELFTYGYSVEKLKQTGLEMNLVVTMPGTIISEVGSVDGNTVTIDLLDILGNSQSEDIVITSDVSNGADMTMIFVAVAAVVVVGIVVVVLKKKKSNKSEELLDNDVNNNGEENIE